MKRLIKKYKELPIQVRASFWFLVCAFLQKGISSITTPIFTRLLSTEEYGQFSVFNSWLSILTTFVTLHLYSGVYVQGLVKFEDRKLQFSSAMQGLSFVLALCWTVVYLIFRDFWNELFSLTTVHMLAMLLIIWTSSVFQFWAVEQRVELKYQKLVALTVAASLSRPLLGIFLVINANDKVTARILGMAVVDMIAYAWLFFGQVKRGKVFYSKHIWKYALLFNLPLVPHYLSMSVLSSSDRIMIRNMVGSSEAGIYNLAYNISLIMTMFNTALMQTIEPWLYKKIKNKQVKDIASVAYPTFIMIAAVNILLIALAPEVVAIFAPKAYYDAIYIIPPVVMSVYFMFAYSFFAVFEFYYEKTKLVMAATTISAALNIVLNFICIKLFGYVAAGYTTLICYILYAGFHYVFMRKLCKKYLMNEQPYDLRVVIAISLSFLSLGFVFLAAYYKPQIRLSLLTALVMITVINIKKIIFIIKKMFSLKKEAKNA